MINSNIAEGSWKKVKAEILKTWGKLTDDEVDQAKADVLSLAGTIQKKFGVAQEEARDKLNNIMDRYTKFEDKDSSKMNEPKQPYGDNFRQ